MAFSIITRLEEAAGLLEVKEVAAIFGVSAPTIYKMAGMKKDGLPCLRLGGIKFDPKALSYWVRKQHPAFAAADKEKTA